MRVDRAEALLVQVPFRRPFLTAIGELTHRTSWIIRLGDADGREGYGEAALDPAATETATSVLASAVREAVDALASGRVPDPVDLASIGEPGRALAAAIDGALATLAAAAPEGADGSRAAAGGAPAGSGTGSGGTGSGGSAGRSTVAVNATLGFEGPAAAVEAALHLTALGFGTLKLKAGAERETEALVERVRAVRRAVGPGVRLRLDVNGAWDEATARERLAAVEPFGLEYVEQPLPAWDLAGHAALRTATRVPVALDESIARPADAAEVLRVGAADVLVVKPSRVGGRTAVREIAALAGEASVPVVVSTFFETGIGVGEALRIAADLASSSIKPGRAPQLAHGLATAGVLVHDLLVAPLLVGDGRMEVPPVPAVDMDALRRYTRETVAPRR